MNEININFHKLKFVRNELMSITIKQIQEFVKFLNYNWKFVQNFLKLTLSLINLIIKNQVRK